jgi:phosphohistidine phosphatase
MANDNHRRPVVYLMRHGQAAAGPEAERRLTPSGEEAAARVAARCRAAGAAPALILTSTYHRAVQTAEIAARVLGSQAPIERHAGLLPCGSPFDVWDLVRERRPEGDLLIVAHEPLLGALAALLLDAPTLRIEVVTAAVLAIAVERWTGQPGGSLLWMIAPSLA